MLAIHWCNRADQISTFPDACFLLSYLPNCYCTLSFFFSLCCCLAFYDIFGIEKFFERYNSFWIWPFLFCQSFSKYLTQIVHVTVTLLYTIRKILPITEGVQTTNGCVSKVSFKRCCRFFSITYRPKTCGSRRKF